MCAYTCPLPLHMIAGGEDMFMRRLSRHIKSFACSLHRALEQGIVYNTMRNSKTSYKDK